MVQKQAKQISSGQTGLMLSAFIGGSALILSVFGRTLGHNRWLSYLLALPFVLLLTWLYGYMLDLLDSLPGSESMLAKIKMLFGTAISKLLYFFYALQFLLLLGIHTGFLIWFLQQINLRNTPGMLVLVLLLLVALYASFLGRTVLARLGVIFALLLLLSTSCDSIFLLSSMHAANLLPLAGFSWLKLWQNSAVLCALTFTDLTVLFILSLRRAEQNKPGKAVVYGILAAFVFLFFLEVRNTLVLGDGIAFYTYPLLETLSFMQVGDFLGRLEAIAMSALFALSIYKILLLFYAFTQTSRMLFPQIAPNMLRWICFLCAVCLSAFCFACFNPWTGTWFTLYLILSLLLWLVVPVAIVLTVKKKRLSA